jgi:hypothetical protein
MLRSALSAVALSLVCGAATGCIIEGDDGDSTLSVHNESSYALVELRLAEVSEDSWGRNLLGSDPLLPGESIGISVDCGRYDVLVVDHTGVDCTLGNVDLCFNDDAWVVDDVILDTCAFNPYKAPAPTK